MPDIILYSISGSPACRSVLMVLEVLGLEATIKEVNTQTGEQYEPEYLEKNPLHTVPLLEEGDFYLPDSHAIVTYLVSKYGADHRATLYPSDLRVRAIVDQRLFFEAVTLFPKFRAIIHSFMIEKATEVSADLKAQFEEAYGVIEKYLEKSSFLATDHVTVADIACIATISTLHLSVPIDEKYVRTHEWWNKLKQYHWYQKGNEEGLSRIADFLKSFLKK